MKINELRYHRYLRQGNLKIIDSEASEELADTIVGYK